MSKLPKVEVLGLVDYTSAVPPLGYHCGQCGVHGVKLWREYNTFFCFQSLLCADCSSKSAGGSWKITQRPDGRPCCDDGDFRTDQIGWRVPAVPTPDGETFWGYSSVPEDGCQWFYQLPLRKIRANK